jgi:2,4-dienoyl-CoA reductase-like NADH-dependent reductase (Old Yellow Enzyme family)
MKKLLDTTKIGNMKLKNRFIHAAIADFADCRHLNERIFGNMKLSSKEG